MNVNNPNIQFISIQRSYVMQGIGALLCGAGIMWAVHARNYLGKNWGLPMDTKANNELVTTGPYRLVRHPIYTGIALAMLGSVLSSGNIWLVLFCIFFPYFIYSAIKEEKRMLAQFPEQYSPYMKSTKMFIPCLF